MPHAPEGMSRVDRKRRDEGVAQKVFRLMNECILGAALTVEKRDQGIAAHHADEVRDIITVLEVNQVLTPDEQALALAILRKAAEDSAPIGIDQFDMTFFEEQRTSSTKPGAKPVLARGNVRYAFFLLVVEYGISKNRARELIAEDTGVTVEAVKNCLGPLMNRYCDGVLAGTTRDPRMRGG